MGKPNFLRGEMIMDYGDPEPIYTRCSVAKAVIAWTVIIGLAFFAYCRYRTPGVCELPPRDICPNVYSTVHQGKMICWDCHRRP